MEMLSDFHFLRPLLLLLLIPALALWLLIYQRRESGNAWQRVIDPALLPALLQGAEVRSHRRLFAMIAIGWIFACLGLAGPSWEKKEVPVFSSNDPLVIVLDLSHSMYATDVKPDRLTRARFKIHDILRQRTDGYTALIGYAGDAHIASPLTDDSRTIANLLDAMNPDVMPVAGNRPAAGIREAVELLQQGSGNSRGQILLVTGGIDSREQKKIEKLLQSTSASLAILGIGTSEGAPVKLPDGQLLKDKQGNIVIPKLESAALKALATQTGGVYREMAVTDADIEALIQNSEHVSQAEETLQQFDHWQDNGWMLVFPLLLLALAGFRKGWLLIIMIVILPSDPAMAAPWDNFRWQNLWQTPDQQGQAALEAGDSKQAAELFENPLWQGQAEQQHGDMEAAAEAFATANSAAGFYNQGNVLAKSGKLDQALAAYDKALEINPELENASFNRKLVEQLKQQQEQQKQQQKGDNNQQNNSDQQDQGDKQQDNNKSGNEQSGDQSQQNSQQSDSKEEQSGSGNQSQQDSQEQNQPGENRQDSATSQQNSEENDQQQASASDNEQNDADEDRDQQGASSQPENQESDQDPDSGAVANNSDSAGDDESTDNMATSTSSGEMEYTPLTTEEQQAMEQWLRKIPDDPGGLLRRKFMLEHQQRQEQAR
ncbi:VWA domain-containing protein [Endozoicomonadaceae bacterium StTr2]